MENPVFMGFPALLFIYLVSLNLCFANSCVKINTHIDKVISPLLLWDLPIKITYFTIITMSNALFWRLHGSTATLQLFSSCY